MTALPIPERPYRASAGRRRLPSLRVGAIFCALILAAPFTLLWFVYGAWLTCREVDAQTY